MVKTGHDISESFFLEFLCYIISMLYTRAGDDGTTKFFGCDQRFSKSSKIVEALGTLDEINSYLGVCKVKIDDSLIVSLDKEKLSCERIIGIVQQDLFNVQAEIAGAEKTIEIGRVVWLETIIDQIEKELPPIKNFVVSGGTEFSSLLDFARTISRRAERQVVVAQEEGLVKIGKNTLSYLNRLSSLLYSLARYANIKSGIVEENPHY